jgi:hypothetical protein
MKEYKSQRERERDEMRENELKAVLHVRFERTISDGSFAF